MYFNAERHNAGNESKKILNKTKWIKNVQAGQRCANAIYQI